MYRVTTVFCKLESELLEMPSNKDAKVCTRGNLVPSTYSIGLFRSLYGVGQYHRKYMDYMS